MSEILVNGKKIFYADSQKGAAKNLVLIHGSGGTHENWPRELFSLDNANVYLPDLPGHGASEGQSSKDVGEYAAFIADFVQALGIKNVYLGGHSLGGAITLMAALEQPDWLSGLVLVGTGAKLRVLPVIFEAIDKDYEAALGMMDAFIFGPNPPKELVEQVRAKSLAAGPENLVNDFTACDHFDVMARLGEIKTPALVVAADEDKLTPPKYGQFLVDGMPDARMEVLAGAGHLMAMEKPAEFVAVVKEFLG